VFKPAVLVVNPARCVGKQCHSVVLALMLAYALPPPIWNIHPILGAFTMGIMVGSGFRHIGRKSNPSPLPFIPIFIVSSGLRNNLLTDCGETGRLRYRWCWLPDLPGLAELC
jgi:hypothetical protein